MAEARLPPSSDFQTDVEGRLVVTVSGDWSLDAALPDLSPALAVMGRARAVAFNSRDLGQWDTSLVTWLTRLVDQAHANDTVIEAEGLPRGIQGLLRLAYAVEERKGARRTAGEKEGFLTRVGKAAFADMQGWRAAIEFLGGSALALGRFFTGRARYQKSELWLLVQDTGAQALPIVSIISFLVGMILAFVGAVQLQQFGAGIFVANLVGLAMAREMGAMMTAIIMAGRTGAAFAAQLGTMRVNEEIDALKTMGVDYMEFLVVPRMVALMVMMPLLAIYSTIVGIIGGMVASVGLMDITITEYIGQTQRSVPLLQIVIGVVKAAVFGVLIAIAGCLRGVQCGNSSQAVGMAATSAVVTGIVLIIVSDGIFAVLLFFIGI